MAGARVLLARVAPLVELVLAFFEDHCLEDHRRAYTAEVLVDAEPDG